MKTELWSVITENQRRAVLINALLGALLGSINISSVVIALPAILRGIALSIYTTMGFMIMAWIMFAYPLIMAITVALIGRLSDMYGRGRVFTIGDIVFTIASLLLGLTPGVGIIAGAQLVIYRFIQGLGASMMFSNSAALVMDAYPPERRGVAQGIVGIAFSAGSIIGLLIGGILATVNWRWVFLFNVPIGVVSIIWAFRNVYRLPTGFSKIRIDYLGAGLLTVSLVLLLMGLMLSMTPYGHSSLGWGDPMVWVLLAGGAVLLGVLFIIEGRISEPMFKVDLFKIRQFTYGVLSSLFLFLAQGANVFVLSLLLQAIYLPLHGIPYSDTPLWAGIYLIPSSIANAIFAPVGGKLLNRFGARFVSTLGAIFLGVSFELLTIITANVTNFSYILFAVDLFLMGAGSGLFQSPNLVSILSAVPSKDRSAASGLRSAMQNIGLLMSFAIFLTLIITGAATELTVSLTKALLSAGLPTSSVAALVSIPPVYALFAAFLGYDPIKTLIAEAHISVSPTTMSIIDNLKFFPSAIAPAMSLGFQLSYHVAAVLAFVAAIFSYLRGKEVFHQQTVAVIQPQRVSSAMGKAMNGDDSEDDTIKNRAEIDLKSDPVLRKVYAAYLLMGTELANTVINALTTRDLIYAAVKLTDAPQWLSDLIIKLSDCEPKTDALIILQKNTNLPSWLNDLINEWINRAGQGKG